MGRTLLFSKGVHCSAKKKLVKMFVFVFMSVANLLSTKSGGISGFFCRYKMSPE